MTMIAQETALNAVEVPKPFEFWITDTGGSLCWVGLEKGHRLLLVCRRALRRAGADPRREGPWFGRFLVANLRQHPTGKFVGAWVKYQEGGACAFFHHGDQDQPHVCQPVRHAILTVQNGDDLAVPSDLWERAGLLQAHVQRIDFGPGTESRVYFTARRR